MVKKRVIVEITLLLSLILISTLFSTSPFEAYKKINPPPDVDKIAHHGTFGGTMSARTGALCSMF